MAEGFAVREEVETLQILRPQRLAAGGGAEVEDAIEGANRAAAHALGDVVVDWHRRVQREVAGELQDGARAVVACRALLDTKHIDGGAHAALQVLHARPRGGEGGVLVIQIFVLLHDGRMPGAAAWRPSRKLVEVHVERTAGWPGSMTLMSRLQPTNMTAISSWAELTSGSHVRSALRIVEGLSMAKQISATSHLRMVATASSCDVLLVSWHTQVAR